MSSRGPLVLEPIYNLVDNSETPIVDSFEKMVEPNDPLFKVDLLRRRQKVKGSQIAVGQPREGEWK
jgi:hypothetical protein